MATSRGQTPPPVNLKERIAALQQRNVSPNMHQSAQAAPRGIPSPSSGGLRDKIAKFEEKGGMPVPRGSFAMGAPQLAENAPPKKRGELYANRVPGLGRPSGVPVGSRAGSPLPSTDEPPGPRKRCISTGTTPSTSPSSFSTDVPVPALPNGLAASPTPRRNSLAVNFGPGRPFVSLSDADGVLGEFDGASSPSPTSFVPEKPPDPIPETTVEETHLEVERLETTNSEAPTVTASQSLEPPPVVEAPLLANPPAVDTPAGDSPSPRSRPSLYDASQNVSQSPSTEQSSKDGHSEYESAPQSATSQSSPSLSQSPSPIPSPVPIDTPSDSPKPSPAPTDTVGNISNPPPEKVAKQETASRETTAAIPPSNPTSSVPPSLQVHNLPAESRPQSKPTFKAVVHRRVTEQPVATAVSSLAPPAPSRSTKQRRGVNNINVVEVPPSPGTGDLAILLEDAALLELRLTEGDGPGSKLETTPTSATFDPDPRHASASTLTEHVPIPSVDSGSQSGGSMSIPSIREPLGDGEIPEGEETDGRSLASTTFSQRSPTHRKYLSNIYRLTSRRSSGYMPGTYPRDSMSLSSEDSSPVTTPSDNGKRKGFGIAWPSASPKKGGPNVGRSSSFADKIFNRNRTKSNVSSGDQERSSLYGSSQPSLTLSFPSELSPESQPEGLDIGSQSTSWISPVDSNPEFSPASSLLDKDIFDAFPSVPQTLPPGFHLDAGNASLGRASISGRKQVDQRLSMA